MLILLACTGTQQLYTFMIIYNRIEELQKHLLIAQQEGKKTGFVPTMGALHQGHLELIRRSKAENDLTICSIFVNPTQFNDLSDLEKYPRTLEKDALELEKISCDVLFAPEVKEMYTDAELALKANKTEDHSWKNGNAVHFGILDKVMEGANRPGHFNGVAQVVSKLFRIVQPQNAYFGQKDFQQLAIIRSMTKQLNLPIQIIGCPIVREHDGLAMSSRNLRLSAKERAIAPVIFKTLTKAKEKYPASTPHQIKLFVKSEIEKIAEMQFEYFELSDAFTLAPIEDWKDAASVVGCIALKLGEIRLIDNILFY